METFNSVLTKIKELHSGAEKGKDVNAALDDLAKKNPERLDWRHSIVDLLKLIGIDSSEATRRQLALDLKYTGDMHNSTTLNEWLHNRIAQEIAKV